MGRPRLYSKEEADARVLESGRRYREENPGRRAATLEKYNRENADIVAARKAAWFLKNPNYLRERYEKGRVSYLLSQARVRAKKNGVPYSITISDITIPILCPVLGIEIRLDARGGFNPNSPSIDRIIPSLGYVPGNVRVISNRANLLKRDATLAELEAVAAYVRRETRPREVAGLLSAIA